MARAYFPGLAQYRGIGRGFLRGSAVITTSNPPSGFTDQQVASFIDGELNSGTIPGPDIDNQTLYCVVMPAGVAASNTSFIGEHTYYTRSGQRIHFAWITNSGSLASLTTIISHELVESATDPEGTAWLGVAGTCSQGGWCEIGDVCSSTSQLDGVTVQSYWSNQAGACTVPAWPNGTYPRAGVQWTGTVPATPPAAGSPSTGRSGSASSGGCCRQTHARERPSSLGCGHRTSLWQLSHLLDHRHQFDHRPL